MDIEGVIIFDSHTGVPLFSRLRENIDPSLFSSFIAAIGHFSNELRLGGLSSFTTEEKVIFLAAREKIITALVSPKKPEYQEAYSLAKELGRQFESQNINGDSFDVYQQDEFALIVDDFMRKIKNPFVSRVAEFLHTNYGGSVSIKTRMMKVNGSQGIIDAVVNLGIKHTAEDNGKKKRDTADLVSENFIFCKVSDGRLSRTELIDFLDSVDGYGVRIMKGDELTFVPYYPSRSVVIARAFAPEAIEFLGRLPNDGNGPYLDGTHVFLGHEKQSSRTTKCPLDVYAWKDSEEPVILSVQS
ncbi:MAG: hypothetical protein JSW61_14075 [Candidatus Thorarchaeota archaeon]|nr:MAG: hypothetical protein JSW61_14075 [Candidatus Thorarchaeota archaeon]